MQEYLKQDIDCSSLQIQLSMIPDSHIIKTAFSNCPVLKVTNVRTIADSMNQNSIIIQVNAK